DRDRSPLGSAVANTSDDGDLILFELHSGTPAVPGATAEQSGGDVVRGDGHACRKALENRDECRPVGLPRGQPTQHGNDLPTDRGPMWPPGSGSWSHSGKQGFSDQHG